ncbi:MAG: DNA-binding response regulator, partial [Rhodoferax sp.]|nr:DNA-binding response regulator [Rhodoferax sp.]
FSPALRAFAEQAEQADPPGRTPRGLTLRESDVLALLAQGWSNKEIAERLGASIRTVETHRLHLRRKLHIEGRAALVKYAVDHADLSMQPPEGTDRGVEP